MKQGQDKLVNSPICDSNACYESEFTTADGPVKTWLCMTSGYTSNTTMKVDSETVKLAEETTADLIKDLRQDHEPPGGGEGKDDVSERRWRSDVSTDISKWNDATGRNDASTSINKYF